MTTTDFNGIYVQLLSNLVQVHLECVTRLRRSVATLRSARRLVRECAQALKFVARNVVSHGLQSACVKGAGNTVAAVGSSVEERMKMHCRNRAILFHTCLDLHQNRMTTTVTVKDFFARKS